MWQGNRPFLFPKKHFQYLKYDIDEEGQKIGEDAGDELYVENQDAIKTMQNRILQFNDQLEQEYDGPIDQTREVNSGSSDHDNDYITADEDLGLSDHDKEMSYELPLE